MRADIVDRPIDASALLAEVASSTRGATVLFVGSVRDQSDGGLVSGIDYSAYTAMAERELRKIAAEVVEQYPEVALVVEHRIGTLGVGEASVGIATAHAHRAAAYEANRRVIEEIKRRVPIWKREHFTDGRREWVGQHETELVTRADGTQP